MGLSIKDEATERLIRRLAQMERSTLTGAVRLAVENQIARSSIRTPDEIARMRATIKEAQQLVKREEIDWSVSEADILGYDSDGIPETPNRDARSE